MADNTINMNRVTNKGNEQNHRNAYEYEESIAGTAAQGKHVLIPDDVDNVNVSIVIATGATGKIQFSNDTKDTLKTGTAVTWFDWDDGDVAVNTIDAIYPPSAVRLNKTNGAGTAKIQVRAQ